MNPDGVFGTHREHEPIVDRVLFDQVQALLGSNAIDRKAKRCKNGALLTGKLYDDRGNIMSPSYSVKNGVRYPFYVSSALLRGRKAQVGSVGRVSATDIEAAVETGLRTHIKADAEFSRDQLFEHLTRVVLSTDRIAINIKTADDETDETISQTFECAWRKPTQGRTSYIESPDRDVPTRRNEKLIHGLVRAHTWVRELSDGTHATIEKLAEAVELHPKIVRQIIRLAFLSPEITQAILEGQQPETLSMRSIPGDLPVHWTVQRHALGLA